MAQKQYTTYQADILSFELRDALLGFIKPGRYIGYDTMSEYQSQVGNDIYCRFTHTNGIKKYDKSSPPVLEATRGVAVSTQGSIIAEDGNVDVTVTITGTSVCYHILYMEHEYTQVQGANPATYGIQSGTPGSGMPTLSSATKRVIIGIIIEAASATGFSDLTYYPFYPGVGDEELMSKLFKDTEDETLIIGTMPSSGQGIIGDRNFANNNYLTDYSSITEALSDLDGALDTEETARIAVGNRAIDDSNWGALSDNTNHNASASNHGLLPKLSDDPDEYLNGEGDWAIPIRGLDKRTTTPSSDFTAPTGITIPTTSGSGYQLNLTGIISGTPEWAYVEIYMFCSSANATSTYGGIYLYDNNDTQNQLWLRMPHARDSWDPATTYVSLKYHRYALVRITWSGGTPGSGTPYLYYGFGSDSGNPDDWLDTASGDALEITIHGWF